MNRNKQGAVILAVASLLAAGLGFRQLAQAQGEAPAAPPGQGFPGGGGGRAFGGGGFGGGGTQMAVSGNNIFVLRGGTLYRINATSLAVEAKGDLPAPAMPQGGFRGGNFRGGAPAPSGGDQGAPPPAGDQGAPPPAGG